MTDELAGKYIKVGIIVASEDGQMSEETFSEIIPVRWKLAFYDEFDYIAKDGRDPKFTEKWISQAGPRILGNPEIKSARIPENVEVDGEYLIIHNRKETNPNYPFEHTWTTGNVYTEPIAKFGYYECSYKLAEATGLNQSFWLMTASSLEHGKFVEVDFNEGHYPYEVSTNLHYFDENNRRITNMIMYYPFGKEGEKTLGSDFVKIGGLLKPNNPDYAWDAEENSDTYRVYINDKLYRSTKSLPYEPDLCRIYLSVAILPGFAGRLIDEEADGTCMVVDYVRYYTPIEMEE